MGQQVSKAENDAWLASMVPIQGELRALLFGVGLGTAFCHESRFGLEYERKELMRRLQSIKNPVWANLMWFLGQACSAEALVPYFAVLYWILDKQKCVEGVVLVPLSEILNGVAKWHYRVGRPGWVDPEIELRAWSSEYSFPSSHAQIIWALATFFSGTSVGNLRHRLFGSRATTAAAYTYFLAMPYVFASLVSVSRVYEGLHYPRDVLAGAGFGVGLASVYMRFLPAIKAWLRALPPLQRLLVLNAFAGVMYGAVRVSHRLSVAAQPADPAAWEQLAAQGRHEGKSIKTREIPLASYVGMAGVLAGLGTGLTFMDRVPLKLPSTFRATAARFVLGQLGLLGTFFGIRAVEKSQSNLALQQALRFCRYGSVAPFILLAGPKMFNALGV